MSNDRLELCEIYPTIKSEGFYLGKSVLMIRLFGTNLTQDKTDLRRYAWDKTHPEYEVNKLHILVEDVLEEIKKIDRGNIFHWVISGGEPMLQQKMVVALYSQFVKEFGRKPIIEWETNGTIKPLEMVEDLKSHFNVRLRLGNSMDGIARDTLDYRIKADVIKHFLTQPSVCFVFDISDEGQIKEVNEVQKIFKIPSDKIYLAPNFKTVTEFIALAPIVYRACLNSNYRFSARLNTVVYGTKRGV